MTRASVLARGRAAALAGMVDTCRITRTAFTTTDAAGRTVDTLEELYAGPCRVQQPGIATATPTSVGEQDQRLVQLMVQLPMSVTGLAEGDRVEIVTSVSDPDLPGRAFVVRDLAHKSDATARRIGCQEAT